MQSSIGTKLNHFVITVDGPAGSGKSSLAKELARRLNACHLNSGLLYRAAAKLLCSGQLLTQPILPEIDVFIKAIDLNQLQRITLEPDGKQFKIVYQQQDWTTELHTKELDRGSAWLATSSVIRDFVLDQQHHAATLCNLVIDGRDCGTVVFPQATVKFFLTASSHARALRIAKRSKQPLSADDLVKLEAAIQARDRQDQQRSISPLKPAVDAIIIDNSELDLKETVAVALKLIDDKTNDVH